MGVRVPDTESVVEAVVAAGGAARTGRWLDLAHTGVGAFLVADGGSCDWYVIGSDGRAFRDLSEAVESFVDTSFARIQPGETLAASHPYAIAIGPNGASSMRVIVMPDQQDAVDERLQMLADVWARRPPHVLRVPRTTGRMLRDLDDALSQGRLSEAEALVSELRGTGRLSSANVEFLEIRLAAVGGRWNDITARPDIDDIARMRLPAAISATVIEAIYHTYLGPYLDEPPDALIERFRDRVEPVFAPAFRNPAFALTTEQRKAWIVHAAAMDPPSATIRDIIIEETPVAAPERAFIEAVAALTAMPPAALVDDETLINQLMRAGDLTGAWQAARRSSLTAEARIRALLHVAYEGDNPVWAAAAVAEAAALATTDPDVLAGRTTQLQLAELSNFVSADGRVISDWLSWLRALAVHGEPERLIETARNQHGRWSVEGLITDPESPELVLDIATSDPGRAFVLRQARPLLLPGLLMSFDAHTERQAQAAPLLAALAEVIASEERIGRHELSAVLELGERVLSLVVAESDYETLVERGLREVWLRAGNARELGWLADAVRLVARAGDQFPRPRRAFLDAAAASVATQTRLFPEDREALVEAFSFSDVDPAFIAEPMPAARVEEDAAAWGSLVGRKTLIYTLIEAAGARARDYVQDRAVGADVVLLTQHDADRRLIEHARRSDVVVIATKAATHAATTEIERQRSADSIVVYPTGKGWSSIVGALREALRDLA